MSQVLFGVGGIAAQAACRDGQITPPPQPHLTPASSAPQGGEEVYAGRPSHHVGNETPARHPSGHQACTAAGAVSTAAGPHPFSTGSTSLANSRIEASAFASGIPPNRNELFSSKSPSSSRRASYARST
jgi:hypothetical protein